MTKLRSDSVFCKLTPEQVEQLEDWLFEEKLGYKEVLERIEKEFGVKGSQSGLSRFYQRLAVERSQVGLVELVGACVAATGAAKPDGALQAGLLTLAYKCAVEFLVKHPEAIREFTALLRALTSAQAMEMKRVAFEREEAELRKIRITDERWEEFDRREEEKREARNKRQKEKRLAKLAAKKAEEEAGATGHPAIVVAEEPAKGGMPNVVQLDAGDKPAASGRSDSAVAEGLNDPAPEPNLVVVAGDPASGKAQDEHKPGGPTGGERSGCFRIIRG